MDFSSKTVSPRLLIIEGNISAGKSTLSNALGELLGYRVFLEPTITNPYLNDFYADPKRWALPMQLWLLRQRFKTYVEALQFIQTEGRGVILDRSVFSDAVFAEKNRLDANISEEGYEYYLNLREQLLANLPLPHVVLYLDVPATVCHERIRKRSRNCESVIPLEYLAGLDQCYRSFVEQMRTAGSEIIWQRWENFGTVDAVAETFNSLPDPEEWVRDHEKLQHLLNSRDAISSRMRLRKRNAEFDDERGCDDAHGVTDAVDDEAHVTVDRMNISKAMSDPSDPEHCSVSSDSSDAVHRHFLGNLGNV